MEKHNVELLEKTTLLIARAKLAKEFLERGIATVHNDQVGWWVGEDWVSFYDIMEKVELND
jgi:hypothetical protein